MTSCFVEAKTTGSSGRRRRPRCSSNSSRNSPRNSPSSSISSSNSHSTTTSSSPLPRMLLCLRMVPSRLTTSTQPDWTVPSLRTFPVRVVCLTSFQVSPSRRRVVNSPQSSLSTSRLTPQSRLLLCLRMALSRLMTLSQPDWIILSLRSLLVRVGRVLSSQISPRPSLRDAHLSARFLAWPVHY